MSISHHACLRWICDIKVIGNCTVFLKKEERLPVFGLVLSFKKQTQKDISLHYCVRSMFGNFITI